MDTNRQQDEEGPRIAKARHASYIRMLRRLVRSGINDSTVSPMHLAEVEAEYKRRYGEDLAP